MVINKGAAAAVAALILLAMSGCAGSSTSATDNSSNADLSGLTDTSSATTDTSTNASGRSSSDTSTTDTSSSSTATAASSEGPGSSSHADDSGFCSSHQCIANFPNGNGYVVQCADGEWSHSGGLSGACSHHGGESNAAPANAGTTPPSSDSSASTPAPTVTSSSNSDLPNQCDPNISTSANVTCGFAENTFYEYYQASGGDPTQSKTIQAWSPTTHQYYTEDCTSSGDAVDCAYGNSNDVRLTASGLSAYSSDQAASYAQSHELGPNG